MSKRKDFRDLFGGDSDEENVQTKLSSTTTTGKVKNKLEGTQSNDKYTVHKKDISSTEKYTESIENGRNSDEKHFKVTTHDQNKKRVKTKHEDNKLQKIFDKVASDSVDGGEKHSLQQVKHQNDDGKKKVKLKKTEIGGLVVKLLTPAYVEKRFDSRDTFKTLARNISHALYDKDEQEIKEYIKNFLHKNEEFTSHTSL